MECPLVKLTGSPAREIVTSEIIYLFFTRDGLSVFIGGWKCHQSSLYFLSSEKKSWSGSRKYCTDKKADLISINNQEEQDFVKNISGGKLVWIGLTDTDVEGTWKWTGQQNNIEEDCALTRSTGWADFPCGDNYKWICEKSIFK
uniref:C-type lectin domain-containing protein n=1 Tax=Cyprinus carpio TaxID=7962 RepID=A0A8C1R703_CYPCA